MLRLVLAVVIASAASGPAEAAAQAVPTSPIQGGPAGTVSSAPQAPPRDGKPQPQKGTAIIRGFVVAADTGTPIRRARVNVRAEKGRAGFVAQTDAQGRFEVAQLVADRYTVSASRSGYVPQSFGQRVLNQPGTSIEIADGQVADKVNFALVRGGAVTGRIVDEFGEPVSGVQVTLQRYGFAGGGRRMMGTGGEGGNDRTDDLGQFRLYGLTPGEYYVTATVRNFEMMQPNTTSGTTSSDGYAPTFYPGTANMAEARRVVVKAGQDAQNASFALAAAKVGRIIGRVTTSEGQPATGAMLMVMPRDQGLGMGMAGGAGIRGDGTFQTQPLPPGAYTLVVRPQSRPGRRDDEIASLDVTVAGEDVENVAIVTGRGGVIRGRISTDDGTVPPFRPQQASVMPMADDPTRPRMGMNSETVRDDWTFEIGGLADKVRLRAFADGGGGGAWLLKSALSNGVDLADTAIDVRPGQVIDGVEVVLTQKVTELSGVVRDSGGQSIDDASIVFFPDNKAHWVSGSRYVRMTRPDAEGKYRMRLTPGDGYLAVAVRNLEDGEFMEPEFLESVREAATSFSINEGESKTLNLRVATERRE